MGFVAVEYTLFFFIKKVDVVLNKFVQYSMEVMMCGSCQIIISSFCKSILVFNWKSCNMIITLIFV